VFRGGALAERRVIDLINRRFVPFFYNVGKGGCGYDADAASFIHEFTSEFEGNAVAPPPIFLASPEHKLLGQLDNFVHQDEFFTGLLKVLRENPDFNKPTDAERAALEAGESETATVAQRQLAARIQEELGEYKAARKLYAAVAEATDIATQDSVSAALALARIERYSKNWKLAETRLDLLDKNWSDAKSRPTTLNSELAMERAYSLLAAKSYDAARKLLVDAIKASPSHDRVPEMHYYAGLASYKLKRKEWASFHWGWVMVNTPDDRHYMRAYSAATNEASPFPNPDLDEGIFKSGGITQDSADAARAIVVAEYERLKDTFTKEDYWSVKPGSKRKAEPEKSDDEKEDGF
jgi:tetratricopeptide (TPR) repeat protein